MNRVHIVEAKRTAIGRFGGAFKNRSAPDLAHALAESVLPEACRPHLDQVILGQVLQAGIGMNVARQVGLKLGLPHEVPGWTVNMACGSSLQAISLAADAIRAGEADLILAGGVENMSRAPHYALDTRWGQKLGHSQLHDALLLDGLSDPLLKISMGETAERIAEQFCISREDQDAYAALSQSRAAQASGHFSREISALNELAHDEHPRPDTSYEGLSKLKPAFRTNGTVTPGNASGMNDGAALVLLASDAALERFGLTSRAQIGSSAVVGCDPALMGLGPIRAIQKVLQKQRWSLRDVDSFEINEAFAVQTLACAQQLGLSHEKLNPRGGAIALGHPIGASGARVLVTLLHYLEDHQLQRGVASLCVGGGMGIATSLCRE